MNMDVLRIDLENDARNFQPGEEVSGRVIWSGGDKVESAFLRLFWHTSGKGDRDYHIEAEEKFGGSSAGSQPFRFLLPEGPYSFSGKLISLIWALELVVLPSGETKKVDIVVAPNGREVRIVSPLG